MAPLTQDQLLHFKSKLRDRSDELRAEIRDTLERSSDETHVRIAEQARDMEDDSFSNLIVDVNFSEIERDADELRRITAALHRAQDGSYGFCADCGGRFRWRVWKSSRPHYVVFDVRNCSRRRTRRRTLRVCKGRL